LGGVSSLRGFGEQELNSQNTVIKGSLSYVNYRTQLDVPISGGLRVGPFLDAANLRIDSFSFGGLRYGSGFGFHYLTPVGPVNLDWGFKLNPLPGEDTNQFYFSIGVL
jgi:outer membrane protein insertion porin family